MTKIFYKYVKICLLLFLPVGLFAQTIKQSEVEKSEKAGQYQKITYQRQQTIYDGYKYDDAYLIRGFQFFFSPHSIVIIAPDGKKIYSENNNNDGWSADPTFYFPKNENQPFIISVSEGTELHWGSKIYIIDKQFKCKYAGYLELGVGINEEEYGDVAAVMKLEDRGKKGIRFTFACDSLMANPATDIRFQSKFSTKNFYFTLLNDTILPCPKWNFMPGVQRMNLYATIKENIYGVAFSDINGDGYEDMYYAEMKHCSSTLVVCLCQNGSITEKLTFELDFRTELIYDSPKDSIIRLEEQDCNRQYIKIANHSYRLEKKELIEIE
jgi:hypothetical protein